MQGAGAFEERSPPAKHDSYASRHGVPAPFMDVPLHVMQAPGIGELLTARRCEP